MSDRLTILCGDVLEKLAELPDESVNCCVTSPPYWGLRDYGTAQWEGGDSNCNHSGTVARTAPPGTDKQASNKGSCCVTSGDCKCGARRIDRQIGLEKTPQEFVAKMVQVFSEVRRVLRKDGVCWVNLGDSYNANQGKGFDTHKDGGARKAAAASPKLPRPPGLKPKDLCGIPWRVAFALQDDGWWLRQDIIWAKPNPMPESVRDRCTKAHEYVFLLTKSAKYWWDAEAIAIPASEVYMNDGRWETGATTANYKDGYLDAMAQNPKMPHRVFNGERRETVNRRSVWTITTQPFPEAHFATFPEELPKLCILASCPPDGTVLDPFAGSGTTGKVAIEIGRKAVLIELNPTYAKLIEDRCFVTPGFAL